MGSLKISLYCEDVDFSFLYYSILFYFILVCGMLRNDIQAVVSAEQGMAACFLSLWSQKDVMPQTATIKKSVVSVGGPHKSCGCAKERVFKVGIQDILKVNAAWNTLISQGSRSAAGTALFAGNLSLILPGTGAPSAGFYYNCMVFNTPWRDFKFSIFLAYNKSNV